MIWRWSVLVACFVIAFNASPTAQTRATSSSGTRQPAITVRGFVEFGITHFLADDTFEAIFGEPRGSQWGAGGQALFRHGVYVEVAVERFRRTGQRVFVFDGTVIPLGISDTVTITPIVVLAGFRFRPQRRIIPYIGGGVGSYAFREDSAFAEAADRVAARYAGYLFVGGSEFRIVRGVSVAGELQLATVPGGLGESGVSSEFQETNLGGSTLRVKFVVGR